MPTNPLVQIARGMHKVSNELTAHQLLAAAEMHIGYPVRLPFHSKVEALIVEDERMVLKYTKYTADIRARETRYDAACVVADVFTRDGGVWSRTDRFEAADVRFQPHAVHESGNEHRDENEQTIRRAYEASCHRPGGGRTPLDNADRTADGYTTDAMVKHWS